MPRSIQGRLGAAAASGVYGGLALLLAALVGMFEQFAKRPILAPLAGRGEPVTLDLEVPDGQCTAVIGRSGSGKSVLLKHIVGLLEPDEGRVLVDGETVHELSPAALDRLRSRFGYVFQFAALLDSMTVFDNVAFPLREHTRAHPVAAASNGVRPNGS